MTSALQETSGRDDRPDAPGAQPGENWPNGTGNEIRPAENQLDLFEILPRAHAETASSVAAGRDDDAGNRPADVIEIEQRPADGGDSESGAVDPDNVEVIVGPAAPRDYLDLGVSDADDLRRLEESIRWLMNAGSTPPPRTTPLPPVAGLSRLDAHDDEPVLLDPDILFTPRVPRRSAMAAGAAKILLVSAIAAPTAYFVASWLQFPGAAAPSDPAPVAAAAPAPLSEGQLAAVAPVLSALPPSAPAARDDVPPSEPAAAPLPAGKAVDAVVVAVATEPKAAPERASDAAPSLAEAVGVPVAAVSPVAAIAPVVAAVPDPVKPALRQADIAMMIERGRVLFEAGDVAAARLFFRRAANAGDASAAWAMGGTYDPDVLTRRFIRGIEADPAEAQRWYDRAREMGTMPAPGGTDRPREEMLAQRR